jgi:Domain of unknown function (DUF222)
VIEHVYDSREWSLEGRESALEVALRAALEAGATRRLIGPAEDGHGEQSAMPPEVAPAAESRAAEQLATEGSDGSEGSEGSEVSEVSGGSGGDGGGEGCPETVGLRRLLEEGAGHLAVAAEAGREQARQAGRQVRALAAFAACRPAAAFDRPAEQVGAAAAASRAARPGALSEVSEWAVDEVAATLGLSARAAGALLADAVTLTGRLPATVAALEEGRIGWPVARMLAEVLGPVRDGARARVEAGLLARAEGRTTAAVRAAAVRAVLRADAAAAAARLAAAIRGRRVRLRRGEDGMATLAAELTGPVAAACYQTLEAYAEACVTPGDPRTKEQRMADCLAELLLRPGATDLPPVQIELTVIAPVDTLRGGDEPGEVAGQPVPAVLVRELAHTLGLLPRPIAGTGPAESVASQSEAAAAKAPPCLEPETETPAGQPSADGLPAAATAGAPESPKQDSAGKTPTAKAWETGATDAADAAGASGLAATERAAADLAALLGWTTAAGTPLASPPTIAIVEEISGQLRALTTGAQLRRAATCRRRACRTGHRPCTHHPDPDPDPDGAGLGPPEDSPGYTPGAALDTFVRFRDRRCRFPGCRARAIRCDLDHTTPWPHGDTSEANLCCLCRHHHRLRHQAPGWRITHLPDGGLQWTLPGGTTITTHPPRAGTDDDLPPPTPPPPPQPPLTAQERVLGRPRPPGEIDDDPAPF